MMLIKLKNKGFDLPCDLGVLCSEIFLHRKGRQEATIYYGKFLLYELY